MYARVALRVGGLCMLVGAAALSGCSKEAETPPAAKPHAETESAAADSAGAVSGSGSVAGRAAFSGTVPPARPIRMAADPYCAQANEQGAQRQAVKVGADDGLAEVFVYVKSGLGGKTFEAPSEAVVLDQKRCNYKPTVLGVQVGQPLEIRNSDSTLHNVHAMPKESRGFNLGMPTKGMTAVRKFQSPEVLVRIKCDVHPWMAAFVGVVDHPFFAVTDASGAYTISGLPAGRYTIEAVHPTLGTKSETVTVGDGAEAAANFAFSG